MTGRLPLLASILFFFGTILHPCTSSAQGPSVARQWNEQLLAAIRTDLARPPVHARNLFHVSAAMYDAWSAYMPDDEPYLLGRTRGAYTCAFDGVGAPAEVSVAQEEAISFAAYRLIAHRYQSSPGHTITLQNLDALMDQLGYDRNNASTDYVQGGPAELGNYIAEQYIAYGYTDGSNEAGNYAHLYYTPVNPPIQVESPGNPLIIDPNHWQQITVTNAVDQNGNPIQGTPAPVGHEWGNVTPFAMDPAQATEHVRDGNTYTVYHDPGPPTQLDTNAAGELDSFFKWNFCMVPIWQSHLDPDDGVMVDISPATNGGLQSYPTTEAEYHAFYDYFNGGAPSPGYAQNPVTGVPYTPQVVKRGDFTRILAEFWADGPNSETPPGHWFTILHSAMDHPLFERRWMGTGPVLDEMEYDVKAYLALGGAMHDAAISAWSIKGWYDYVRPVSAIRYMAGRGQSSDPGLPHYHPAGLPLIPGLIELVGVGDELSGLSGEHLNKVKLFTWRGPSYIGNPSTDNAGVGWILAENWWPYQRPTFVTPPFSGYVSGHSTFSRSAAEVLTLLTGTPYFPGGMSNFHAPMNEFLEFENGPSEDIYLQWATYRDASDQCSLSRIWGGIHVPVDDIPGRLVGQVVGPDAVNAANALFASDRPQVTAVTATDAAINIADIGSTITVDITFDRSMDIGVAPTITYLVQDPTLSELALQQAQWTNGQTYSLTYLVPPSATRSDDIFLRVTDAVSADARAQDVFLAAHPFIIDTDRPLVVAVSPSTTLINDAVAATASFIVLVDLSEACDMTSTPTFGFQGGDLSNALVTDPLNSMWLGPTQYLAAFTVADSDEEFSAVGVTIDGITDELGNALELTVADAQFDLDTRNPLLYSMSVTPPVLGLLDVGSAALVITLEFDEVLNTALTPDLVFTNDDPLIASLTPNITNSSWVNDSTYQKAYNLLNADEELFAINAMLAGYEDLAGNPPSQSEFPDLFIVDTHRATVQAAVPSTLMVMDDQTGTGGFHIDIVFPEPMDIAFAPFIQLTGATGAGLQYSSSQSNWTDPYTYRAMFNVTDLGVEIDAIGLTVDFARDPAGNTQFPFTVPVLFALDTRNPAALLTTSNTYVVTGEDVGPSGFFVLTLFDESMNTSVAPQITFDSPSSLTGVITLNTGASSWLNASTYQWFFDVGDVVSTIGPIGITITDAEDQAGNPMALNAINDYFSIDLQLGVNDPVSDDRISLYPNPVPTGGAVTLHVPNTLSDAVIEVYDLHGSMILTERKTYLPAGDHKIQLPDGASGLYLLRIMGPGQAADMKFMRE
ncbi:MAG: T9SS type A sorting domain-containing protein [Flavobacteriales bacterium]|nr:T9SS type A sorting domain-containing protein [Flavobacteriales bacterium]